MVGTRIPKDAFVEDLTEKNGVKYVLKSHTHLANPPNEIWRHPEGSILIDCIIGEWKGSEIGSETIVYLLSVEEKHEMKSSGYVCQSKIVSIGKSFFLPRDASLIDVSLVSSNFRGGIKYKVMYLIPRQPEKPFEGFEYL